MSNSDFVYFFVHNGQHLLNGHLLKYIVLHLLDLCFKHSS